MFLLLREMDRSKTIDLALRVYPLRRPFRMFVVAIFVTLVRLQAAREAMMRGLARD